VGFLPGFGPAPTSAVAYFGTRRPSEPSSTM
jgi:hypothetical protein